MITAEHFGGIPLFAGLAESGLAALIEAGREDEFASGQVLFRQNVAGDTCFVVLAGTVRLHQGTATGELELARIGPGGFFGEMALIDGGPRSATATVAEAARLFVMDRHVFLGLLSANPQMLGVVLARLVGNLRTSDTHRLNLLHQQQLLSLEAEMARLRSISQMVAGVAHEVNTPLGIIVNAASLMADLMPDVRSEQNAEVCEDLTMATGLILKNARHAADLVQTFRSLSVRQITHAHEKLPLAALIQEVLGMFELEARKLKLTIRFASHLPPDADIWDGIPGHLTGIVLNLLTNVGRYAYPPGTGGIVDVQLVAAENSHFLLTVRDYGAGISPTNLPRIFDPFFTTGRDKGGVGLGLAIVHETVTAGLGGRITVSSLPGEGAMFSIHLPQRVPESASNQESANE